MIERHATIHGALHPLRANDLTASDVAAAIYGTPFKSQLDLYAEKTGQRQPKADNALMRRGRLLEPVAVQMLREEHPDWEIKYPLNVYLRDAELRLGATPDAMRINANGTVTNLQVKVVNRREFEAHWVSPIGPPMHYVLQAATEGMLMDAESSMLVTLVVDYAGLDLYEFPVERIAGAEENIKAHAKAFWDNIANGKFPAADVDRDGPVLADMYREGQKEPIIDLSADNQLPEMLDALEVLKADRWRVEAAIKKIETYVKDKLGPHENGTLPGWRIKWPTTHRQAYSVAEATYRAGLFVTKQEEDAT